MNQEASVSEAAGGRILLRAPQQQHPQSFWANLLSGLYDVRADDGATQEEGGQLRARLTPHYLLAETRMPHVRLIRSASVLADGFDGFALRLTSRGRLSGRTGDKFIACGPGDVLLLDFLEPIELNVEPDGDLAEDVTVWMPRPRVLAAVSEDHALSGFFLSATSASGAAVGGLVATLAAHAGKGAARDLETLIDGLLALLAKVVAATPLARQSGTASFVTVRRYVDRNLRSASLGVEVLSQTFGISRAALYRLFEPVGGVASYIRQARLRLAWQQIVYGDDDARKIAVVAYQLGFKNISAFNRAFRDAFGVNPSQARHLRNAEARSAVIDAETGVTDQQRLALWLDGLGRMPPIR